MAICFALGSLFCLSGCLEEDGGATAEELEYLDEEVRVLKENLEKAHVELDEYDLKFEDFEKLEKEAEMAEKMGKELEEIRQEKEEVEQQMKDLRQEYEDYQKKYEAKVRGEAKGEKYATLKLTDRTLTEVVISEVTERTVKIRHANGFATLNSATAPTDWKKRFFLRSEEEIEERAILAANYLNATQEEGALEGTEESKPSRPLSNYAQRKLEREKEEEAMKVLSGEVEKAIVLITGDGGEGTGFFAQDGITTYLYSAAHVFDQNRDLKIIDGSGKEWKQFGEFEVAVGIDLVRLAVAEPVDNALTIRSISEASEVGTIVASFGNAGSGGAIAREEGKIRGVGANSYEISGQVLQGNSGGPVLNSKGEVLAVVTRLLEAREDIWIQEKRTSRVRRFGCRVDTNIKWKEVSLGAFIAAQDQIAQFDKVTRLLLALSALTPTTSGLRLDSTIEGKQTIMQILKESSDTKVVKEVLEFKSEIERKNTRISERDMRKKFTSFYSSSFNSAKKQNLRVSSFSPYHEGEVKVSIQYRQNAMKQMSDAIAALR